MSKGRKKSLKASDTNHVRRLIKGLGRFWFEEDGMHGGYLPQQSGLSGLPPNTLDFPSSRCPRLLHSRHHWWKMICLFPGWFVILPCSYSLSPQVRGQQFCTLKLFNLLKRSAILASLQLICFLFSFSFHTSSRAAKSPESSIFSPMFRASCLKRSCFTEALKIAQNKKKINHVFIKT